ncbi:hypothetical protein [Rhizobium rhizoryzae]|uniref:hypothetical protein n=1 Tax=Rhizobium rhizoryzae TaxID=451876 RepID=UPI0028A6C68E|nr:hypothetical protein [Rhizobium rhizoryzae]
MLHIRSKQILSVGAALWLVSSPAFALDGADLMKKLTAGFNLQPGNITPASVDINGSNVTLKGVTVGDTKGGSRLNIGDVQLTGVKDAKGGGYTVEKMTFANINASEDKTKITAKDLYFAGLYIPGNANGDTIDSLMVYDEAHSGPVEVTVDGKQVVAVAESKVTTERADDNSSLSFSASVDGVKVDLSTVDDANAKATIESLGLTKIDGTITMEGEWEVGPGTIDITEYAFDFANIGRLDMTFSLSGYTPSFLKSLRDTTAAMEANPNKEAAQQAAGLAMLGLLQQLTFNSAQISFSDDGITKRSLNYAGKSQNVSGEQMAMMLKGMVPLAMAQANLPKLQNAVSSAVNAYLDNPQNIMITAEPANPVPLPMIIGAAQAAPNSLPDMLGVSISAND